MQPLVTSQQMQEIDRRTISNMGLPELLLMEHAALGVVKALQQRFGDLLPRTRGIILAGMGNNGGDALAVARILDSIGVKKIFVGILGTSKKLKPSTKAQSQILGKLGIPVFWPKKPDLELFESCDWIIDGIFGTGLTRDVQAPYLQWINYTNQYEGKKWIISIDVPSGLDSDTGQVCGKAVKASQTVTLGFIKKGLVTGSAADYVGLLTLEPIQIPRLIPFSVNAFLYGAQDAIKLPQRRPTSHKGTFGHVYVWAPEDDKQGAGILTCLGALRSGAGLVTLVGNKERLKAIRERLPPEIMTEEASENLFKNSYGVWVQGPGMGIKDIEQSFAFLEKAIQVGWKCVLDADLLNAASSNLATFLKIIKKSGVDQVILTPHPKEAARLLDEEVREIERDRFAFVKKLAEKVNCSIVLKGKGTLIQSPERPCVVVCSGDTGLSKGGTGDLLAGVLASFLAQGLSIELGAPLAVYIHGKVSERVTQVFGHERSTLAGDLANQIIEVLRELESQ